MSVNRIFPAPAEAAVNNNDNSSSSNNNNNNSSISKSSSFLPPPIVSPISPTNPPQVVVPHPPLLSPSHLNTDSGLPGSLKTSPTNKDQKKLEEDGVVVAADGGGGGGGMYGGEGDEEYYDNNNNDEEYDENGEEEENMEGTGTLVAQLYAWCGESENFMFTKEQIQRYQTQFSFFDKDKSGAVSVEELGLVFNQVEMDWTEDEIHEMILEIDADKNGYIEFPEFLGLMARKLYLQMPQRDELRQFFDFLDKDKDGTLTTHELHQLSLFLDDPAVTAEQLQVMISEADKSGKGGVTFEEFAEIMDVPINDDDEDAV